MHEIKNSFRWIRGSSYSLHVYMRITAEVCIEMGRYLGTHFKSICITGMLNFNNVNTTDKHIFGHLRDLVGSKKILKLLIDTMNDENLNSSLQQFVLNANSFKNKAECQNF